MRRLPIFLLCGCGASPAPAPPPVPREPACVAPARAELARAGALRGEGRLDRALRVADRAVAGCAPAAPLALGLRLELLSALGRHARALALAGEVGPDAPEEARAAARRAREAPAPAPGPAPDLRAAEDALAKGAPTAAFEEALLRAPLDPPALVGAGLARLARGDRRGGRELLDRALVELEARHGEPRPTAALASPEAPPGAPLARARLLPSGEAVLVAPGVLATRVLGADAGGAVERHGAAWVALGRPARVLADGARAPVAIDGAWRAAAAVGGALVLVGEREVRAIEPSTGRTLGAASWPEPRQARVRGEHVLVREAEGAWSVLRAPALSVAARVESISEPVVRSGRVATTLRWNARATVGLVRDLATGKQLFRRVLGEIPPDPAHTTMALAGGAASFAVASHGSVLRVDGPTGRGKFIERWPLGADEPPAAGWLAFAADGRTVCSGDGALGWSRGDAARPCFLDRDGGARPLDPPRLGALWAALDGGAGEPERPAAALSPDERHAVFFYRDPNVPAREPSPSALVVVDAATSAVVRRHELGVVPFEGWVGFSAPDVVYLRARGEPVRWFRVGAEASWREPERVPLALQPVAAREGLRVPRAGACLDPFTLSFRGAACAGAAPAPLAAARADGWTPFRVGGPPETIVEVGPGAAAVLRGGARVSTLVATSRADVAALLEGGAVDALGAPRLFCRFGPELVPFEVCADRFEAPGLHARAVARPELAARPVSP